MNDRNSIRNGVPYKRDGCALHFGSALLGGVGERKGKLPLSVTGGARPAGDIYNQFMMGNLLATQFVERPFDGQLTLKDVHTSHRHQRRRGSLFFRMENVKL